MAEERYIRALIEQAASAAIEYSDLNTDRRAREVFTEGLANVLTQASEAFIAAALLFREHGVSTLRDSEVN